MRELQDILNSGEIDGITVDGPIVLTPQPVPPIYVEGQIFYDDSHKSFACQNDSADVTINPGKEFVGRVYNDTGSTIPNGTAVAFTGSVTVVDGIPTPHITPAIAVGFTLSRVVGLVTEDIVDGSIGYATSIGRVHNLDTSAFAEGSRLYLDDTTPGALSESFPSSGVITRVGAVIKSDISDGVIYVSIEQNTTLPTTIGLLDGVDTPTTPQLLLVHPLFEAIQPPTGGDVYLLDEDVIDSANKTTGQITTLTGGWYEASVNFNAEINGPGGIIYLYLQVWDVDAGIEVASSTILTVGGTGVNVARSFSKLIQTSAGDKLELRLSASVADVYVADYFDVSLSTKSLNLDL